VTDLAVVAQQAGEEAYPRLRVPADALAAFVAARARPGTPAERLGELYLTCACARGDADALAELERAFFPDIRRMVLRRCRSDSLADEVMQILRATLLLARGDDPPEIADFTGAGPLAGWLRVVAVRIVLRFLRKEERHAPIEEVVADRMAALDDPELRYIRDQYGDAVQVALREAWLETSTEDRNLLRYRYVDGYGVDQIAAVHRIHRATAGRWVNRAEEALVAAARRRLEIRYRVVAKEMQSLLRLIRSHLLVSARTIFRSA
jgi:RNA polymerase sigma-70 factor (ECF subfamily)